MVLISVIAMILGVVLIRRGLRGRAVDNHPLCSACGFDLYGLVEVTETQSDECWCPECGADAATPQTRQVGNRERLTGRIKLGAGLVVLASFALSLLILVAVSGVEPIRYAPLWWVLDRATSESLEVPPNSWDEAAATAYQAELVRRISEDAISREQVQRVVRRAQEVVIDDTRPLNRWLDVFDAAEVRGLRPDDALFDGLFLRAKSDSARLRKAFDALQVETMQSQQAMVDRIGLFDREKVGTAVAHVLQIQPRLELPIELWGNVYEAARANGLTTIEQDRQYLEQVFQFVLVVRSPIRAGDPHPFELQAEWRGLQKTAGWMRRHESQFLSIEFVALTLGGEPITIPNWLDRPSGAGLNGGAGTRLRSWWGLELANRHPGVYEQVHLDPGEHVLRAELHYWFDGSQSSALSPSDLERLGCENGWTVAIEAEIRVEDRQLIRELDGDPAPVRRVLEDGRSRVRYSSRGLGVSIAGRTSGSPSDLPKAPTNLAFETLVRIDGTDYPLGHLVVAKGGYLSNEGMFSKELGAIVAAWVEQTGEREIEIVFRPSVDVARQTLDIYEIWSGPDIVVRVPLEGSRSR